jgi:hypothetical protein
LKVKRLVLTGLAPHASETRSTPVLLGETSRISTPRGKSCWNASILTVTSVTLPCIPDTAIFDG